MEAPGGPRITDCTALRRHVRTNLRIHCTKLVIHHADFTNGSTESFMACGAERRAEVRRAFECKDRCFE